MKIPFELFIALRYLRAKRKQTFISLITLISVLGVILGVMALIIVLSVMSGFQKSLREKILGINAHVVVLNYQGLFGDYEEKLSKIKEIPEIKGSAPFLITQVLVSNREKSMGVVLKGIKPSLHKKVLEIEKFIKTGSLEKLEDSSNMPNILIGKELALNMGVIPGDKLVLILPQGAITPFGIMPKMVEFNVAGIFETGMFDYDATLAYANLGDVQKLLGVGDKVTGIEISVKDIFKSDLVSQEIQGRLGLPFKIRDWKEMNRNLFSALRLEKTALFIILLLIVLVAAFNIITTLVMLVMEKNKDIAILKSMGATYKSISLIFKLQGIIIGLVGTSIGGLLGVVISLNLHRIVSFAEKVFGVQLLARDVYFMDRFPSSVDPIDVILVCTFSFLICYLATLYPAKEAAKMEPAEVLRYE